MPKNRPDLANVARILILALPFPVPGQQGAAVRAAIEANSDQRHPGQAAQASVNVVPEGIERLTLSPGALLQMEVFGAPEMSAQLRVNARGEITVPLLGAVSVSGQTASQAQQTIAKVLASREILRDPQVILNVLQYPARDISIVGEVQMPGRIPLLAPEPLADALATTGGTTPSAGNDIEIRRADRQGAITTIHVFASAGSDATAIHATLVEPGDTVLVHRAGVIYVLGAVNRPGGYLMVNGGSLNVVQAVALAGGETSQAEARWATIVRKTGEHIEQIRVPLRKMETGKEPSIELQLNDALYVPSSGWKSLVMNGSNVFSAAASASIYAASRP
jgi:polysaccharide biosynthesis/export protein